jgi:hypothetical protein
MLVRASVVTAILISSMMRFCSERHFIPQVPCAVNLYQDLESQSLGAGLAAAVKNTCCDEADDVRTYRGQQADITLQKHRSRVSTNTIIASTEPQAKALHILYADSLALLCLLTHFLTPAHFSLFVSAPPSSLPTSNTVVTPSRPPTATCLPWFFSQASLLRLRSA